MRPAWSWQGRSWDKLFAAICVFPWAFAETSDIMKIQTILKEANPVTRGEALKDFFRKTILPVAAWYVPLTLYRLLTAGCACIITED